MPSSVCAHFAGKCRPSTPWTCSWAASARVPSAKPATTTRRPPRCRLPRRLPRRRLPPRRLPRPRPRPPRPPRLTRLTRLPRRSCRSRCQLLRPRLSFSEKKTYTSNCHGMKASNTKSRHNEHSEHSDRSKRGRTQKRDAKGRVVYHGRRMDGRRMDGLRRCHVDHRELTRAEATGGYGRRGGMVRQAGTADKGGATL